MLAFFTGLIIYIVSSIAIVINPQQDLNWLFLIETFTNSLIALIIGFGLWMINFWSAGDGKLFFIYSFIIPISVYSVAPVRFFQSFYLIFNSFIPFLILAIILTVREKITDIRYGEIREELSPNNLVSNIFYTFAITWISKIIINILHIKSSLMSIIITSSLIVYILRKYIYENIPEKVNNIQVRSISMTIVGIILVLSRVYLEFDKLKTVEFWWTFLIYYIIISIMKGYVKSETKIFFTKPVHVLHLREGMVLVDPIIKKDEKYTVDKSNNLKSRINSEFPSELDDETVKKIIKVYKRNKCTFTKLLIHKTMPFAPLMFIGAILTILAQGAFILANNVILNLI